MTDERGESRIVIDVHAARRTPSKADTGRQAFGGVSCATPTPETARTPGIRLRLGEFLLQQRVITPDQLAEALSQRVHAGEKLGHVLVRLGLVEEAQLLEHLSALLAIPVVPVPDAPLNPELLSLVPPHIARKYDVLPIRRVNGTLTVAMADPTNLRAVDDLMFVTSLRIVPVFAALTALRRAIRAHYESSAQTRMLLEAESGADDVEILDSAGGEAADLADLKAWADQAPVIRVVNAISPTRSASFLRHDPDVLLVGEMRDTETAQIGIRAALTGHLVLTTLHTIDCASAIPRLLDMGVPGSLLASCLRLTVAQRLLRRVCVECREAYEILEDDLVAYGHRVRGVGRCSVYRSRGCAACRFTGMRGRFAVYEMMPMSPEIHRLIGQGGQSDEVRAAARREGMLTLREAALLRVLDGSTTLDEVLRTTPGNLGPEDAGG